MIRILFICLILFCTGGCGSLNQQSYISEKQITDQNLKLLPPDQGPASSLLKQTVTIEANGERHEFIAIVRLEQEKIQMLALLPTGQQLFLLEYDGENLSQKNYSSINIPGEEILSILQFSLWPEFSVKQTYLESEGWNVEFTSDQRRLKRSTHTWLEVDYQGDDLIVKNHWHDYRILIHTLEKKTL